jgi:hypothetical protein
VEAAVGEKRHQRQQPRDGWLAVLHHRWRGRSRRSSRIHVEKVKRGSAAKGGREKRVMTAADSDTKLRIIERLNLMVSKPFYIYV